jgi:hypothetical protein
MQDNAVVPFEEIEMYDSLFPDEPNFVSGRAYVRMVAKAAQICQSNPSVLYGKRLRWLIEDYLLEQVHLRKLT